MSDCGRVVGALLQDTNARSLTVDDYVVKRDAGADSLMRQFSEIERSWGQFRILPGERERLLDKASYTLREHYTARTLAEAGRFSKKLLGELVTVFTDLKAAIDQAETTLGAASDQAMKVVSAREMAKSGGNSGASFVTTVGDPRAIEATRRKLVLNEEEMRVHTGTVRGRIAQALGQRLTFAALAQRLN